VVDPTGGLADLAARVVRLVGPEVLADDPLRGLRAVRIAAQLGFTLEERSQEWIRAAAPELASAAPERSREELWKSLAAPAPATTLQRLDELALLPVLVPETIAAHGATQSPPHREDVWGHTLSVVAATARALAAVREPELAELDAETQAMLRRFAPALRLRL